MKEVRKKVFSSARISGHREPSLIIFPCEYFRRNLND